MDGSIRPASAHDSNYLLREKVCITSNAKLLLVIECHSQISSVSFIRRGYMNLFNADEIL